MIVSQLKLVVRGLSQTYKVVKQLFVNYCVLFGCLFLESIVDKSFLDLSILEVVAHIMGFYKLYSDVFHGFLSILTGYPVLLDEEIFLVMR